MAADDVNQLDVQAHFSEYQNTLDTNFKSDKSSYPTRSHDFNQFVNKGVPSPYEK